MGLGRAMQSLEDTGSIGRLRLDNYLKDPERSERPTRSEASKTHSDSHTSTAISNPFENPVYCIRLHKDLLTTLPAVHDHNQQIAFFVSDPIHPAPHNPNSVTSVSYPDRVLLIFEAGILVCDSVTLYVQRLGIFIAREFIDRLASWTCARGLFLIHRSHNTAGVTCMRPFHQNSLLCAQVS